MEADQIMDTLLRATVTGKESPSMSDMRIQTMTEIGLASFEEYKHSLGYLEGLAGRFWPQWTISNLKEGNKYAGRFRS